MRLCTVNSTTTQRAFSPERGFLTEIMTTTGFGLGTPIQNLAYHPDESGALRAVTSPFDRETWNYEYDEGHRLTSAVSPTPPVSQTFQYDAIDRMTYNTRFGIYTYPSMGG